MNRDNRKITTKKLALCGVFAALCLTMLWVLGLSVLDLSVLVLCSLMTMLLTVETGDKMTWIYVAVTGVLALLLLPSKLYAVEYVCFAAVYPVLKLYIERLPALPAFLVKISLLDCMLLLCIVLGKLVFVAGEETFSLSVITLVGGTAIFIVYDLALTTCISWYIVKLRKKLGLKKLF